MTPSPRARKVAEAILDAVPRGMFTANEVYLREAIARALDAEREACAQLVAECEKYEHSACADLIRALADEETP